MGEVGGRGESYSLTRTNAGTSKKKRGEGTANQVQQDRQAHALMHQLHLTERATGKQVSHG